MNALEKVDGAAKLLVWLLCIDTNATKATYKLTGLRHKEKLLGDYEITIKKIK